jgi:hypothetical protein
LIELANKLGQIHDLSIALSLWPVRQAAKTPAVSAKTPEMEDFL